MPSLTPSDAGLPFKVTLQNKYRLTGALFLLALFVLLAPMLFDADGVPRVEVKRLPPSSPMQPVQAPVEAFGEDAFQPLIESAQNLRDEVDVEGFRSDTGTKLGDPEIGEPMTAVGESTNIASSASDSGSDASNTPQTTSSNPASVRNAYVVRVASFSKRDNALALQKVIRESGYESFLSTSKQDDRVWTRVLVGPYLVESEAREVQQALSSAHGVEAQIHRRAQ